MADFFDTLKERQREYRKLLRNLLKRVRKYRRKLEQQQREKAMRTGDPGEKTKEVRASIPSADVPLFTAALEAFRLAMLGRPSRKGDRRRRRQAKKNAGAERPRNWRPAVRQSEKTDLEKEEGEKIQEKQKKIKKHKKSKKKKPRKVHSQHELRLREEFIPKSSF